MSDERVENGEHDENIYWHNAFNTGYRAEFQDYEDVLDFIDEYQLSKEALIMDILIIKKKPEVKIEKNIGKIFRGHNITEYKSPTDSLSIADYHKVMGYAFLYIAFNEIALTDVTVTFVVTKHPRVVIDYLQTVRKLEITEVESGIYYAKGDVFPIQILENKKLSHESNVFLGSLRTELTKTEMYNLLFGTKNYGVPLNKSYYYRAVLKANLKMFEEVSKMNKSLVPSIEDDAGWEEFFYRTIPEVMARQKARQEAKAEAKAKAKAEAKLDAKVDAKLAEHNIMIAKKLLLLGNRIEDIADVIGIPVEKLETLRAAM
ncbi:MAG: hypothetical protein FWG68_07795 [Defluviitaleaceae bacterium]|nr:hypothetical protein [Defluviitaleaceae bacterium]